eukprot:s2620_g2.t1
MNLHPGLVNETLQHGTCLKVPFTVVGFLTWAMPMLWTPVFKACTTKGCKLAIVLIVLSGRLFVQGLLLKSDTSRHVCSFFTSALHLAVGPLVSLLVCAGLPLKEG